MNGWVCLVQRRNSVSLVGQNIRGGIEEKKQARGISEEVSNDSCSESRSVERNPQIRCYETGLHTGGMLCFQECEPRC